MFDDVGKALEYLKFNTEHPMRAAAIRYIEEELARLYQELAIVHNHLARLIEKLDDEKKGPSIIEMMFSKDNHA